MLKYQTLTSSAANLGWTCGLPGVTVSMGSSSQPWIILGSTWAPPGVKLGSNPGSSCTALPPHDRETLRDGVF